MKLIIRFLWVLFSFLLISCYGVNEENSYFFSLSTCCNKDSWGKIFESHEILDNENAKTKKILAQFDDQPFPTRILYFKDYPEEYIGLSENNEFIRYVYNERLSNYVLDGFSKKLSESEKIRIGLRINSLLMPYLNEEGRRESIILIKIQCENYLKKTK